MSKTIKLQECEINLILNVLSEKPYIEVAATIQSIKEQVDVEK